MAEIIDEQRLNELFRDFPADVAGEVLQTFVETSAPLVEKLARAAYDGDHEHVAQSAHRLKGGCLSVGADALAELCTRLERAGLDGADGADLVAGSYELEHMWRQTRAALERRLPGHTS